MKKSMLIIAAALLLLSTDTILSQSCDVEGQNCSPYWMPGGTHSIEYSTTCTVDVNYDYMVCDGVTYFKITSLSYVNDDDGCDDLEEALFPNGCCTANQELLGRLWKQAYEEIVDIWFIIRKNQYPNQYNCPNTYSYRTITAGGCASWRHASKTVSPSAELNKFIPVPCEEDGCCIHEVQLCWDVLLERIIDVETSTTVISIGNCELQSPLYNPFEGYGPEWNVSQPLPCVESCYIWY